MKKIHPSITLSQSSDSGEVHPQTSFTIFSQLNSNSKNENHSHQLALPLEMARKPQEFAFQKRQKPQIQSTPGVSPKQRDRYRVVVGNRILGDRLAIDEALKLAGGAR